MKIYVFIKKSKIPGFFNDAIKEYEKRLGAYCKIKLISYNSLSEIKKTLINAYHINIITGCDSITSERFAGMINGYGIAGISTIVFTIGEKINCIDSLCLTSVNAEPGLMAVLLYEQLYRAYSIINDQPYHK